MTRNSEEYQMITEGEMLRKDPNCQSRTCTKGRYKCVGCRRLRGLQMIKCGWFSNVQPTAGIKEIGCVSRSRFLTGCTPKPSLETSTSLKWHQHDRNPEKAPYYCVTRCMSSAKRCDCDLNSDGSSCTNQILCNGSSSQRLSYSECVLTKLDSKHL